MGLKETAPKGDRVATLRCLRDTIADKMDGKIAARDFAALSRQLTDVLAQISDIENQSKPKSKETPLNVITLERASRLSGAKDKARAKTA